MKSDEKSLRGATTRNDDVHQLRGIRLKGLKRDPSYFLENCKVEPAHLEECFDADTYSTIFSSSRPTGIGRRRPASGQFASGFTDLRERRADQAQSGKKAALYKHLVRGEISRVAKRNDILIKANGQQWELKVPENNSGTGHQFTLCTIQKDNKEHWIRDWIKHYRKIGVDRVILYDNNSEKLPDVDAIVIPCPYKYGFDKYLSLYGRRLPRNGFLQGSLLTICGYKYRSGHLLNFDIDELLQVKNLEKYKERKLVYFDSYFVETKTNVKLPQDYSFQHFVYRSARLRNEAYKYMVKMDAMLYSRSPHQVKLKGNFLPRRLIIKLKRIWWPLRALSKKAILERDLRGGDHWPLQAKLSKKATPTKAHLGKEVFYHYKGNKHRLESG